MMHKKMKVKFIKAALFIFKTSISALVHMLKIQAFKVSYISGHAMRGQAGASSCEVKV